MLNRMQTDLLVNEELEKIPSLWLKNWKSTRWLGWVNCLEAVCVAYPYVLNHSRDESRSAKEKSVSDNYALQSLERQLCQRFWNAWDVPSPRWICNTYYATTLGKGILWEYVFLWILLIGVEIKELEQELHPSQTEEGEGVRMNPLEQFTIVGLLVEKISRLHGPV